MGAGCHRCGVLIIFLLAFSSASLAQAAGSSNHVIFTASDKHGNPVTLLDSDVLVSVDHQRVTVEHLHSLKDEPLVFALLVDISGSNRDKIDFLRNTAVQTFQNLASGDRRGFLGVFNSKLVVSRSSLQASQVQDAFQQLHFGGETALYDSVAYICSHELSRSSNPKTLRRILILLADGDDNASHNSRAAAIEAANREGIAIFAIGILPSTWDAHLTLVKQTFRELTEQTGGRAILAPGTESFAEKLHTAVEEQFQATFQGLGAVQGKLHTLEIKPVSKNIEISAPSQFATE